MASFINGPFVKNSSIFCVALELALVLALIAAAPATAGKKKKSQDPADLTNFLLSPQYSQWLVGPIGFIADEAERKAYLALQDDAEAAEFIADFWEKRGGAAVFPAKRPKAIFDERKQEADRLFDERTYAGHRTDRGTIFVLYGDPREIRFEAAPRGRGEFLEIWEYEKNAAPGLDGRQPETRYYFVKIDGHTTHYKGPRGRQIPRSSFRQ